MAAVVQVREQARQVREVADLLGLANSLADAQSMLPDVAALVEVEKSRAKDRAVLRHLEAAALMLQRAGVHIHPVERGCRAAAASLRDAARALDDQGGAA